MPQKRDWWNKEFKVMMAVGDSITAGGWASCRERRWTNLLAEMIGELQRNPVQLVNVGIGANIISSKFPGYKFSQKPASMSGLRNTCFPIRLMEIQLCPI